MWTKTEQPGVEALSRRGRVRILGLAHLAVLLAAIGCRGPETPVGPTPPPVTTGATTTPGSGARVRFESQSACGCTRGGNNISLRINAREVGTLGCSSGSRSFDVAPGRYAINACDASGDCWRTENETLSTGDEYRYVMFCSSSSAARKVPL